MQMKMLQQMTLFPDPPRMWGRVQRRKTTRRRRAAEKSDGRGRHGNSLAAHGSIEAALEGRRAEIVAWVDLHGPCTVRCINEGLFGERADMDLTRPRVTELLGDGRLVECGKVPDHATGRSVMMVDLAGRESRPNAGSSAPAYVCEQCGCGMSMPPPPWAIEEMKPRLLCGACLSGLRVDGRNDADEGMQS